MEPFTNAVISDRIERKKKLVLLVLFVVLGVSVVLLK